MKVGEAFDPRFEVCGFYPADIVDRQRGISDGPKRLYRRLIAFVGPQGCFPAQVTLAGALGKSERGIWQDLHALEDLRLLVIRSRACWQGPLRSNGYEFLWHEMFESEPQHPAGHSEGCEGVSRRVSRKVSRRKVPSEPQDPANYSCTPGNTPEEVDLDIEDLDYPATNSKSRNSQLDVRSCDAPGKNARPPSECKQYPKLKALLSQYLTGGDKEKVVPSDRQVVDVMDAAGAGVTEEDAMRCLVYLHNERGLRPGTEYGPHHFAWFPTAVADYFDKVRARAEVTNPSGSEHWTVDGMKRGER